MMNEVVGLRCPVCDKFTVITPGNAIWLCCWAEKLAAEEPNDFKPPVLEVHTLRCVGGMALEGRDHPDPCYCACHLYRKSGPEPIR